MLRATSSDERLLKVFIVSLRYMDSIRTNKIVLQNGHALHPSEILDCKLETAIANACTAVNGY